MNVAEFFRWLFGFDRSGRSIDTPRFRVEEDKIVWGCHVCGTHVEAPAGEDGKIEKRAITDGYLDPPGRLFGRENLIFVTRATLRELNAERESEENPSDVLIRERLVYHENYDSAFAHKDY